MSYLHMHNILALAFDLGTVNEVLNMLIFI